MKKLLLATAIIATSSTAAIAGDLNNPMEIMPVDGMDTIEVQEPLETGYGSNKPMEGQHGLLEPITPNSSDGFEGSLIHRPLPDGALNPIIDRPDGFNHVIGDNDSLDSPNDKLETGYGSNKPMESSDESYNSDIDKDHGNAALPKPRPDANEYIEQQKPLEQGDMEVDQHAVDAAQDSANAAYNAQQDEATYANTHAIKQNSKDITTLFNEVDRLDDRIDGSMASNQAALAARPYMGAGQTSAIGVGVGHTGDVQALAIGVAQRLNTNWTLNGNVSATTGSDSDVSVGVGTSYAW